MPDTREYKTVSAFVKSTHVDEEKQLGIVDHLISVYGIIDGGQDMAHKGMFTKTIKERANKIKVIDNHNKNSVLDSLGIPLEFYEVARHGLPDNVLKEFPDATGGQCVKTQFLLDTPEGYGAFTRLKAGAISEFSYAYKTMQKDYEDIGDIKVRHLREVKLFEYGPVLFPMNEAASMISAKTEDDPESVSEEPLAWTEVKEAGMARQMSKIREAFYADWRRFEDTVISDDGEASTTYKWYNIVDVFEKYLIVDASQSTAYYKVDYSQEAETYTFAEKSDWVEGMLEFVPKAADSKDEALEVESSALDAELEAMRKEFGLPDEAEPENDAPPFTSKSQEELDTELKEDQENLEDLLKQWEVTS